MLRHNSLRAVLVWCLWCLGLAPTTSSAQVIIQPTPPGFERVDILVLPPTGDPMTVAPIATRSTPVSATTNCNFAPTPPGGTLPLVNPVAAEFDDPFTPGRVCRVPLPDNLPAGQQYRAVGESIYRSVRSAVGLPPFDVVPPPPPQPPDCTTAVKVVVGTWSRNNSKNALGTVTYSLLQSVNPITQLVVKLNGQIQDVPLTANDLRRVSGSYYQLPGITGSYALSVEARDSLGCTGVADRPMTVTVK